MNQLSTNIKTHVIISFAKNKYFITAEQEVKLRTMPNTAIIFLEGGVQLKCSSISEILPIDVYYNSHPEERPVSVPNDFSKYENIERQPYSKNRHLKRLNSMLIALNKFDTLAANSIKFRIKTKIKEAEKEKIFKPFSPTEFFNN